MKALFCLFGMLIIAVPAYAEEDFFGDLLVSDEMKNEMAEEQNLQDGQMKAGELLDTKPIVLKLDGIKGKVKEEAAAPQVVPPAPIIRDPAPFGLLWLAPIEEIRALDVSLKSVEVKDVPNTYQAENLPKPVTAFSDILISFGSNDALWRIAAYGKRTADDSSASKGVAEYRKYYKMLDQKYGNATEFYTPVVVNVEEKVDAGDGTSSIAVRQEKMAIGAEGFLEQLVSGNAVLYATFENGTIGVTLALLADGDNQTYIAIDYKNLTATKLENDELYDAL